MCSFTTSGPPVRISNQIQGAAVLSEPCSYCSIREHHRARVPLAGTYTCEAKHDYENMNADAQLFAPEAVPNSIRTYLKSEATRFIQVPKLKIEFFFLSYDDVMSVGRELHCFTRASPEWFTDEIDSGAIKVDKTFVIRTFVRLNGWE